MDVRKILVVVAILLIAIIGYNYYSSMQSKESRAARTAEIEALRAKNAQAEAQNSVTPQAVIATTDSSQPETRILSDEEIAAANKEVIDAANKEKREASNASYAANKASIDAPENKVDDSICDSIIKVSESIMRNRQNGISIAKSLEIVSSVRDGTPANEAISALTKQIVIQAYEMPSFSTESYKDDAVREFGAKQYLACMRAFN